MASEESEPRPQTVYMTALTRCIRGGPLLSACKGLESTVMDEKKSFHEKVKCLISVWENVAVFMPQSTPEAANELFEFLHRHTVSLFLQDLWKNVITLDKNHLGVQIDKCNKYMTQHNCTRNEKRCSSLQKILHDPWCEETYCKISSKTSIAKKEMEKYFENESVFIVAARIEFLLKAASRKIAERYITKCKKYYHMIKEKACDDELLWFDDLISFSKWQKVDFEIIAAEFKSFDYAVGFLHRLFTKDVGLSLTNYLSDEKHYPYTMAIMGKAVLLRGLMEPLDNDNESHFRGVVYIFVSSIKQIVLNDENEVVKRLLDGFTQLFSKITKLNPRHLDIIIQVVTTLCKGPLIPTLLGIYIRGINVSLNEILRLEEIENDKAKKKEAERMLSYTYLNLAEFVKDDENIFRECVLTAYSLNPCSEFLSKVKSIGKGLTELNSNGSHRSPPYFLRSSSHNHCHREKSNGALISVYLRLVTESKDYNEFEARCDIIDKVRLKMPLEVLRDMISVISSPRNKMLTWLLDWNELELVCDLYLSKRGELWEEDLKYLHIDYDQFKNGPPVNETELYGGIEIGYENCIEKSSSNSSSSGSGKSTKKNYYTTSSYDTDDYYCDKVSRKRKKRNSKTYQSSSSSDYEKLSKKRKLGRPKKKNNIIETDCVKVIKKRGRPRKIERSIQIPMDIDSDTWDGSKRVLESKMEIDKPNLKRKNDSPINDVPDNNLEERFSPKRLRIILTKDKYIEELASELSDSSSRNGNSSINLTRSVHLKYNSSSISSDSDFQTRRKLHGFRKNGSTNNADERIHNVVHNLVINPSSSINMSNDSDYETLRVSEKVGTRSSELDSVSGSDAEHSLNKTRILEPSGNVSTPYDSDYETLRKSKTVEFSDPDCRSIKGDTQLSQSINNKQSNIINKSLVIRRSERIRLKLTSSSSASESDSLGSDGFRRNKSPCRKRQSNKIFKPKNVKKAQKLKIKFNFSRFLHAGGKSSSSDDQIEAADTQKTGSINWNPRIVLQDVCAGSKTDNNFICLKNGMKIKNGRNISNTIVHNCNLKGKDNCNLSAGEMLSITVPGLTSLDMIVPPPTESTVQVVQLSSNMNSNSNISVQSHSSLSSQPVPVSESVQEIQQRSITSSEPCKVSNSSTVVVNSSANQPAFFSHIQISQNSSSSNLSANLNSVSTQNSSFLGETLPQISNAQQIAFSAVDSGSKHQHRQQLLEEQGHSTLRTVPISTPVIRPACSQASASTSQIDPSIEIGQLNVNVESSSEVSSDVQGVRQAINSTSTAQHLQVPISLSVQTINSNAVSKTAHLNQRISSANAKLETETVTPVLKFIYKDGRLLQTRNQQSDSSSDSVPTIVKNKYSFRDLLFTNFVPKPDGKVKEITENEMDAKNSSSQVASLPKFQQAFGKSMYQSNSSAVEVEVASCSKNSESSDKNSDCSSDFQISQPTVSETSTVMPVCTVLSKAVQTSSKESDVKSFNCNNKIETTGNEPDIKVKNVTRITNLASVKTVVASSSSVSQNSRIMTSLPVKTTSERSGIIQAATSVIFPNKSGTLSNLSCNNQRKTVAVLRPAKLNLENLQKDSVIHNNNNSNALLHAALQGPGPSVPCSSTSSATTVFTKVSVVSSASCTNITKKEVVEPEKKKPEVSVQTVLPAANVQRVALPSNIQKNVRRQPVLQTAVVAASSRSRNDSLISSSAIETSVSPKTLEQLREFESVFQQVANTSQMKERSTVNTRTTLESLGQQIILSQTSSNTVELDSSESQTSATSQKTSVANQGKEGHALINLTFGGQSSTNSLITNSNQKISSTTPVVVVQSCNRPLTTALTTSGSSSSVAKINVKSSKSTKSKSTNKSNPSAATLKVSTLQKPQQKPQEDEQTTQRIYAILDKYAEQLRNSPELKNKPAPRRRSNPPTNPSPTSKRKKTTQTKSKLPSHQTSCSSSGMEMSPGSEDVRTIGSEDSSNGTNQISQVINSPHNRIDETSTPTGGDVSSETSESLDAKDSRIQNKVVLTDTASSVQSRAVIVQESIQSTLINVEGSKLLRKQVVVGGTTAVPLISLSNVPGTAVRLLPVSATDGRFVLSKVPKMYKIHQVTMPSGSPLLIQPVCVNKPGSNVKQVKHSLVNTITQTLTGVSTQPTVVLPSDGPLSSLSDTVESGESVGINFDNSVLLNTTSAPSLLAANINTTVTTTHITQVPEINLAHSESETASLLFSSNTDLPTTYIKQDGIIPLSSIFPVISATQDIQEKRFEKTNSEMLDCPQLTCSTIDYKSVDVGQNVDFNDTGSENREDSLMLDGQCPKAVEDENDCADEEADEEDDEEEDSLTNNNCSNVGNDEVCDEDGNKTNWSVITSTNKSPLSVSDKEDCHKSLSLAHSQTSFMALKTDSDAVNQIDSLESKGLSCNIKSRPFKEFQCEDDSASSDSAGSGRVKRKQLEKKPDIREVSNESDTPWRYTVSKLRSPTKEQCDKTASQKTSVESHSVVFRHVSSTSYKRKSSENTIYQMAFCKSRNKLLKSKEHEPVDRTVCEELRLQKSLSEECEDLGVGAPNTSDLFPEAELLIDPDPSSRDSHVEFQKHQNSDSSGSSTPVNGGSVEDKDSAVLGSAWDEESSVCLLPLQEDSSGQIPNNSNSPPFLPLSNPAVSAPYTYSNKTNFKASRKKKLGISWERVLKKRFVEKDQADSDASESQMQLSEYGKCGDASTTDEEILSEGEYQCIPHLSVRYSSESSDSAEYLPERSSLTKHSLKHSTLKCVTKIVKETRDEEGECELSESPPVSSPDASPSPSSSPSPPSISAGVTCSEVRLPGFSLSSRRSSLRGHIKKGCPCCNGSPERPKRKRDIDSSLNPDRLLENMSCSKKNKHILKSYSVKKR